MGRVYLPADDMAKFGVTEDIIANREATREFKALMRFEIDRTRQLFVQGYELVGHVNGIAKVDLALFTGGGLTILRSIEKLDYDVLTKRPEVSKLTKFRLLVSAYTRSRLGMRPLSKTLFRQAGA